MMKIPYVPVVGSLMYAMVCTRPHIGYAVGVASRFMRNPGREHYVAVKWILQYLKGTSSVCLRFGLGKPLLEGFTDPALSAAGLRSPRSRRAPGQTGAISTLTPAEARAAAMSAGGGASVMSASKALSGAICTSDRAPNLEESHKTMRRVERLR